MEHTIVKPKPQRHASNRASNSMVATKPLKWCKLPIPDGSRYITDCFNSKIMDCDTCYNQWWENFRESSRP